MKAPIWWPGGLRNDHSGPLNAEVHRKLIGIYEAEGAAQSLIALLRSDEEIDRHTRAALANALEAALCEKADAIRLRLVKPAHRTRSKMQTLEQMLEMQEAAKLYRLFRDQGLTWDEASALMQDLGWGKSRLAEALDYDARRIVSISCSPKKSSTSSE